MSSSIIKDSFTFVLWTFLKLVSIPIALLLLLGTFLILSSIKRFVSVKLKLDIYSHLPAVKSTEKWSLFLGDLLAIAREEPSKAHLKWLKELDSPVYVYRGMFYSPRLLLADSVAMNFILGSAHAYDFPKPQGTRNFLTELLGDGVLTAEGDVHKRQRKLLQPAFSVSAVRELQPVFFKHGNLLAKHLLELVEAAEGPSDQPFIQGQTPPSSKISEKGKPVMDISFFIQRATLDVIGEAAFATNFSSIASKGGNDENEANSMVGAFTSMLNTVFQSGVFTQIQLGLQSLPYPGFSLIRHIPTERRKKLNVTFDHVKNISQKIIDEKRNNLRKELNLVEGDGKKGKGMTRAELESSTSTGKDLLYILMRANMGSDVPVNEQLDDDELRNNLMTILFAGQETTSTLLSWTVWTLARNPEVQSKLRSELEEVFSGREELSFDELNNATNLKYLDNVSKEMMRFYSPVTGTIRVAGKDTVIPLSKAYKTRDGKSTFNQVPVKKGQELMIPISVLHTSPLIWGENAEEFDPERWNSLGDRVKKTGFPNGLLTFIEGPRGCIGNRFAIAEFKAILCSLILNLKFEAVPGWEIEPKQSIVLKGRIVGQEKFGTQIPVRISKV